MTSELGIKNKQQLKRKRLGQYFSGEKLSMLLASFAGAEKCLSVIDPMCGIGDMLRAVRKLNSNAKLVGIDIDGEVISILKENLSDFGDRLNVFWGNAFDQNIIKQLPQLEYDLVITNPPYVRYQSLSKAEEDFPSSEEIREGLIKLIPLFQHLDKKDKEIFSEIIKGYSGLADLAVPSWILCSILTKIGGRLAMVVPESWLNRDYAYPIHYLLLKYFQIEYVIEDLDRVWFKDAQVKTNLVVAKRIPRVENLWSFYSDKKYLHIGIPSHYINDISIVGNLYPNATQPEIKMFQDIKENNFSKIKGIFINEIKLKDKMNNLFMHSQDTKWFNAIEKKQNCIPLVSSINHVPLMLKEHISTSNVRFSTLEELGVKVGQGLRTGANKFFYVDLIEKSGEECLVKPDKSIMETNIVVPCDALRVVLRKQNELPKGYCLNVNELKGRVLLLDRYIHPDDYQKVEHMETSRKIMPKSLAEFINKAAVTNVGSEEKPKFIPQLSAVKTNVKPIKDNNADTASYWYMLPKLSKRHLPDIFVARINGDKPKFILNSDPKSVIDANFSCIWIENSEIIDKYALLALLNSDWVLVCCELMGSVMGGGALKLEATHLRKIPIPDLSVDEFRILSEYGKRIVQGEEVLNKVNDLIARNIYKKNSSEGMQKIRHLLELKLMHRKRG
uniref:site-specific DNA-methyltransferase (adenine-specific) n=1 Tax=Geobacillus sp. (strain Y4.1MC1) TaxID=581103 RepID=A0A7U3YH29_GEOS0